MLIDSLSQLLAKSEPMQAIIGKLDAGDDATLGVPQSARPLIAASLYARHPRPMLVVVSGEDAGDRFARSLASFIGRDHVFRLPERPDLPWQDKRGPEVLSAAARRCRAIDALGKGRNVVVVASARALLRCVPPQGSDVFSPLHLAYGMTLPFESIAPKLVQMGYERLDEMGGPGTFVLHGDTLDIYPPDLPYPVRAEFFGDDIDGLRRIVPTTGQSIGNLDEVSIYPCREMGVSERGMKRVHEVLDKSAADNPALAHQIEMLGAGIPFGGMDAFMPLLYRQTDTPFAHIGSGTLVVLAEPRALFDDAMRRYDDISSAAREAHQQLSGLYVKPVELDFGSQQRLTMLSIMRAGGTVDAELKAKRPEVGGTDERFYGGIRSLIASGDVVVLSIPDRRARESIELALSDQMLPIVEHLDASMRLERMQGEDSVQDGAKAGKDAANIGKDAANISNDAGNIGKDAVGAAGSAVSQYLAQADKPLEAGLVNVADTDIPSGIVIPEARLAIISLADASGRRAQRVVRRHVDPTTLSFPYKPGDYVVHAMHGIALFKEIVRQEVAGVERDYLLLEYAEGDRLFVPVEQVDRVTRYVGPQGIEPRLTRLNTSDWTRAMGRARKSAKKLAFDLVDLYARRSTVAGFKYSPDTPWQHEMEESFPYDETPDQLAAIADIKADMESDRPTDRLVCGDVGFGKTEVVLRAAFKAVQDNRQVMVLCPTTILAQQHFTTFSERFEPFGMKVEVLSRFRTPAQQKAALDGIADGSVDVIIGTHRLLSRDVNPKDLGLVIIDEEQRFGVGHKEQLKSLREQVDVISLSATPIPRTMQMALSGVRDMSLIETPPPERTPVKVHVGEWDSDIVSGAIRRELARNGQVYYVSNRVKTIDEAFQRVAEAAPEARIGVAHGQMGEHELEAVMESFAAREIDVLVSTTIIESGIDNPHTNTLIIEDSQRLGLAQLYQLKGRVGRGHAQAYAYFLFPADSLLTDTASDRLAAIAEFQALGSGTKIAMRDLEIRGAGSMLGAEQSGNMSAVGFDLFAQMLSDAVAATRGEATIAHPDIKIELGEPYYLPEEYIPAVDERMLFYRRLASAMYAEDVDAIEEDMRSKYGGLPLPAENLLARARIKAMCARLGADSVAFTGGRLVLQPLQLDAKQRGTMAARGAIYMRQKGKLLIPMPHGQTSTQLALDLLDTLVAGLPDDTIETKDDEDG